MRGGEQGNAVALGEWSEPEAVKEGSEVCVEDVEDKCAREDIDAI